MTMDRTLLEKAILAARDWSLNEDGAIMERFITTEALSRLTRAAQAHLDTLPRIKPVEKWGVTYWSLTHKTTLCRVYDCEEDANHGVELNGSTARKHQLPSLEWMEPPT